MTTYWKKIKFKKKTWISFSIYEELLFLSIRMENSRIRTTSFNQRHVTQDINDVDILRYPTRSPSIVAKIIKNPLQMRKQKETTEHWN